MRVVQSSDFVILNELLGEEESLREGEVMSIEYVTSFHI
jgi:hypothetical protein